MYEHVIKARVTLDLCINVSTITNKKVIQELICDVFGSWFLSVLLLTVNLSLTVTSELVMLSLDLVKTRLSVMSMEMRKNFIQVILTSLIEKSPDPKILRAVVKIVEEWVKNNSPMAANQVRG